MTDSVAVSFTLYVSAIPAPALCTTSLLSTRPHGAPQLHRWLYHHSLLMRNIPLIYPPFLTPQLVFTGHIYPPSHLRIPSPGPPCHHAPGSLMIYHISSTSHAGWSDKRTALNMPFSCVDGRPDIHRQTPGDVPSTRCPIISLPVNYLIQRESRATSLNPFLCCGYHLRS